MATFPGAIATFRTMVNRVGVLYDALKTKVIYAEDFNKERDEIVAIETELGVEPKGADADVVARLDRMDAGILASKPLSQILTATRDMASASGDVAYTGLGFKPSSIHANAVLDGRDILSLCFSDSAKNSSGIATYAASNYFSTFNNLVYILPAGGQRQLAVVKSYDDDGFTLTWTKSGASSGLIYLSFICYK